MRSRPNPSAVTFRGYLRAQTGRRDPVGDLARVAFGGACPGGCRFTTQGQLMTHLATAHPSTPHAVFAAFRRTTKEFRARGGRA